jgi:hypothetical protein
MKIISSSVTMSSQHTVSKLYTKSEVFRLWGEQGLTDPGLQNRATGIGNFDLMFAARIREVLGKYQYERLASNGSGISDWDRQKMLILNRFLSILGGRQIRFRVVNWNLNPGNPDPSLPFSPNQNWESLFKRQELYRETEKLSFSAGGVIKTADGKEISFETELNLEREFAVKNNLQLRTSDPLIINFNGPGSELTSSKFSFDLDTDGKAEQISFAGNGSGFLALDANKDGIINNGAELFGPANGNGFSDLAQYDGDDNGWIDENDPVFKNLRIWTKNPEGKDVLFALGQLGIGAIYTGNISGAFDLYTGDHQLAGKNQSLGIFAREDGTVGTVQQADLVV